MTRAILILLALALCACGGGTDYSQYWPESETESEPSTNALEMPPIYADWEYTPRYRDATICAPEPITAGVQLAAERYYRAIGVEILVTEKCDGRASEDAYFTVRDQATHGGPPAQYWGNGPDEPDRMWLRSDMLAGDYQGLIAHEMGHFLAYPVPEDQPAHHDGVGVIARPWVDVITADDLAMICENGRWPCQWFEPEAGR